MNNFNILRTKTSEIHWSFKFTTYYQYYFKTEPKNKKAEEYRVYIKVEI